VVKSFKQKQLPKRLSADSVVSYITMLHICNRGS